MLTGRPPTWLLSPTIISYTKPEPVTVTESTIVEVPETYVVTTTDNGYVESYVVTTYVSEVETRTVPGTEEPIVTTYVTEVPVTKTETYTIPPSTPNGTPKTETEVITTEEAETVTTTVLATIEPVT